MKPSNAADSRKILRRLPPSPAARDRPRL